MRVLIIGGTGLISTAITRELSLRGDEVTVYSRGLNPVMPLEGVRWMHGDRTMYAFFESQMKQVGLIDCVIDMICYLPEEARSLVRAFTGRTGQVIFCSTVDVYSKPASRYPINEQEGRQPLSLYGANKVSCEDILVEAHQRGNFPLTILRPAYTYGEGSDLLSACGSKAYLDRMAKGRPIVVPGDGNCLWVTCHRDDVGRAFAAAAGNSSSFGKIYNTAGEDWMTWDAYHQGVAAALGVSCPELVHIPTDLLARIAFGQDRPRAEIFSYPYIFDNSAARKDLNFRFTIPWVDGARRTIHWLLEHGRFTSCDIDPFEDRLIEAWKRLGAALTSELSTSVDH